MGVSQGQDRLSDFILATPHVFDVMGDRGVSGRARVTITTRRAAALHKACRQRELCRGPVLRRELCRVKEEKSTSNCSPVVGSEPVCSLVHGYSSHSVFVFWRPRTRLQTRRPPPVGSLCSSWGKTSNGRHKFWKPNQFCRACHLK